MSATARLAESEQRTQALQQALQKAGVAQQQATQEAQADQAQALERLERAWREKLVAAQRHHDACRAELESALDKAHGSLGAATLKAAHEASQRQTLSEQITRLTAQLASLQARLLRGSLLWSIDSGCKPGSHILQQCH